MDCGKSVIRLIIVFHRAENVGKGDNASEMHFILILLYIFGFPTFQSLLPASFLNVFTKQHYFVTHLN